MARKPRIHFSGAFYHVILKSVNGEKIFRTAADRKHWEALVVDGVERFGHQLHSYCWAPDHIQMAVEVSDSPLSKVMQNLTFRYTRHFNSSHSRSGSLFHGRYKAIVIDPDVYLGELASYIHNNPARNGPAKSAGDRKWTSHAAYLNKEFEPSWLTTDRVLSAFGKADKSARKAFGKFVETAKTEGFRSDLERGENGAPVLGDKRFVKKALKPPKQTPKPMSTTQLVKKVCKLEGVKEAALVTQSRARSESLLRQTITFLAVENNVASLSDMAKRFNRDLTTMSRNQRYFRDKLAEDRHLQKHLKQLNRALLT